MNILLVLPLVLFLLLFEHSCHFKMPFTPSSLREQCDTLSPQMLASFSNQCEILFLVINKRNQDFP